MKVAAGVGVNGGSRSIWGGEGECGNVEMFRRMRDVCIKVGG